MPDQPKQHGQKVSTGEGGKKAEGQGEHTRPSRDGGGGKLIEKGEKAGDR
jgi:hypothetical protein